MRRTQIFATRVLLGLLHWRALLVEFEAGDRRQFIIIYIILVSWTNYARASVGVTRGFLMR
jgi:hypothetical protein